MFNFTKTVANIHEDFESLLESYKNGDIVFSKSDHSLYVKAEDTFIKYDIFAPNYSTINESMFRKEMKVYKCPNCNNSIHYLQAKCEFCNTKISWL